MADDLEEQGHGGALRRGRKRQVKTGHGLLKQADQRLPAHASADEPTVVRWVARNIDNPDPDPLTCPDPFAWTLLRTCREDPTFVPFFVEKLWAKLIPARSQLDGGGPREFDGKPTLELIDRIEAMRNEAEATDSPPLASPPPASRPSAFREFKPEEE